MRHSTLLMDRKTQGDAAAHHVTLADGAAVTLREATNEDAAGLREMAARLGPNTYWLYFHIGARYNDIWAERVAALGRRGRPDEYALVAEAEGHIVGVARFEPTDHERATANATGAGSVDIGILLADDWQERKLGRHMLYHLASEARRRAIPMMVGDILWENTRMQRLARRVFPGAQVRYMGGGDCQLLLAPDGVASPVDLGVASW
ncbi:MAG: N-acetyltransferase family protein [Ktedonobacterales bacterium]